MAKERRISFEDEKIKELEKKVDELAAENRELLTFVDESVRIAEEFKQKAFLMGENLDKNVQLIFARALYEHRSRDPHELSLSEDEIIVIEGNIDDDGFYSAKNFKQESGLHEMLTSFTIKNTGDGKLRLSGRLQRKSFVLVSQNDTFSFLSGPNIKSVIQKPAAYCRVLELQVDDQTVLNISQPIIFSEKRPSFIKIIPSKTEAKVILPETEDDFHLHLRSRDYQNIVALQKGTSEHIFTDLREATDYCIVFHGSSYVFTTLGKTKPLSISSEEQNFHIPSLKNLRGCLEGSLLRIEWDEYHDAKEYKLYFRDGLDLLGTVKEGDATSLEINYDVNIDPQQVFCMEVTDINGNSSLRERIPITMVVRAIYDYLPETMSLNPDYSQELPFCEHDLLTVRLPMDKDGFYFGKNQTNNMQGLVPSNFVQQL